MKLYVATDHAGFALKEALMPFFETDSGAEVVDCGAHTYDSNDDYPDFISLAAQAVSADPVNTKAIIFGGSGQGEAMLANRYKEVRATVYYGGALEIVKLSREHNNANVLSIGARFVSEAEAKQVITLWLATPPSPDEKYERRIAAVEALTATL